MTKSIAFGGHFDLGERIKDVQQRTIAAARAEGNRERCSIGILIGDIDFNQKVAAYIRMGIEGVKDAYRKRLDRNPSGCVRMQLPETEDEIEARIDEDQYAFAKAIVETKAPRLFRVLKEEDLDVQDQERRGPHHALAELIRNEVVVPLGAQRMIAYGLQRGYQQPEVRIYSERELKNVVAVRIRPSRARADASWQQVGQALKSPISKMLFGEVCTSHAIPSCRGILLALYEELATEGFNRVMQHYQQNQYLAIQNAVELYAALNREISDDKRWQLEIRSTFYNE